MSQLEDDLYEYDRDDEYDESWHVKEPDCGLCNGHDWIKAYGYRRVLARVVPLWLIWGSWRGLLHPWGRLGDSWPCPMCNPMWMDRALDRFWYWLHTRSKRRRGTGDDELPF